MDVQYIESKLLRRPHSPMFARLANEYLASGKIDEALELCTSGLERFPGYTTAHLVRAKCLAAKEDYISALLNLHYTMEVFPDSAALRKCEAEWKEKAVLHSVVRPIAREIAFPKPVITPPAVQVAHPVISEISAPIVSDSPREMPPYNPPALMELPKLPENIVEIPASLIVEQKSPPRPPVTPPVVKDTVEAKTVTTKVAAEGERIVSKTLAEIYATQGEFEEAILTYQLLKQQRPQNAVEFERRIKELELKLQAKQA